jgi:ABC-type phosphate transport system substrate-binding protein
MHSSLARLLGAAVATTFLVRNAGGAIAIEGAGATVPAPLYVQWAEAYKA